jgi:hypothetical protein
LRNRAVEFGLDVVTFINDEVYQFKSSVVRAQGNALLTELFDSVRGRKEFTIIGLYYLVTMMLQDGNILKYVYEMPGPTY